MQSYFSKRVKTWCIIYRDIKGELSKVMQTPSIPNWCKVYLHSGYIPLPKNWPIIISICEKVSNTSEKPLNIRIKGGHTTMALNHEPTSWRMFSNCHQNLLNSYFLKRNKEFQTFFASMFAYSHGSCRGIISLEPFLKVRKPNTLIGLYLLGVRLGFWYPKDCR